MAGAIAQKLLDIIDVKILAHTVEISGIKTNSRSLISAETIENNPLKCVDAKATQKMLAAIELARKEGDSLGGIIEGIALNVPAGLGQPIFDTMEGELAKALFAIPAVKGVEFGAGFAVSGMKGSENNDAFRIKRGAVITETNNSGGILGGISNGMPIVVRAAVKPTPSISRKQETVNIDKMENAELEIKGRHDVCIVPRAVPVVAAMMAITLCDFALQAGIIPEVIK
jgi:chorismate synthase